MITEAQYFDCAMVHNLEVTVIKAVAAVESSGKGFLDSGEPVILFEPHIFWRELKKRNYHPEHLAGSNSDILYEHQGTKPYGPPSAQHERLKRASLIDREAALCSASWGRFQILGNNYKLCDCGDIQVFINAMYKSEGEHLRLFMNFISNTGLIKFLRAKIWDKFAEGYNGKNYKEHNYHIRLANAYEALRKVAIPNQLH